MLLASCSEYNYVQNMLVIISFPLMISYFNYLNSGASLRTVPNVWKTTITIDHNEEKTPTNDVVKH